MRTLGLSVALSTILACGGASHEPEPVASSVPASAIPTSAVPPSSVAPPPTEGELPPPIDVCLVSGDSFTHATAYPSRAGTYDPAMPIDPALLNWSLPNRGCVTPPLATTPHVPCPDAPPLPAVTATPCGQ